METTSKQPVLFMCKPLQLRNRKKEKTSKKKVYH